MLLKNGGKCFKNKYFDKAEKKLKEREEKAERSYRLNLKYKV